ncbi:MAG: substrate-binding domain-containing protein [Solirubrobacterales bacterium]|nr:substrate-binding domain-containing protein [Solirubrobacterales bacterium]MBV9165761.1 substrate-binding domain-containing protein [Solirubrobacterales bacterium]MBV9534318.1 substrate-binding domain-containing protein [Solirubrobacterales bacterium]
MSEHDILGDAIERLEWDERKVQDTPLKKWHQITRRSALTGGAAGIAALALEACGSSSPSASASSSSAASIFGFNKSQHYVFVNHVTTNIFFTPTQNAAADACKLLGCSYNWTGSSSSNVAEMVNAINSAVTSKADGIATTLISPTAFTKPVQSALSAGIPVVAYNADEPQTGRLSYIGQDLFLSGQQMGQHIASLVPSGEIGLFIATPGSANIQPRINGALATLKSHPSIKPKVVATGAAVPAELTVINSWATGHPTAKGMFAVDAGSTQGLAQTIQKQGLRQKGWKGGGYDLTPVTEALLAKGYIDFTIDQQPYLQGFLPVLQLYLYNASQRLTGIAEVDTGLKFLTKTTILPYSTTKSRYEGTGSSAGVQKS